MTLQHDKQLNVVIGNSRKATAWNPLTLTISELYSRLETPIRGTETVAEYLAMSKNEQDVRKDIGGFVGGMYREGAVPQSAAEMSSVSGRQPM